MKRYRMLILALVLTCLMLATVYAVGLASTLTPPYVVAIQDTGANTHPYRVGVDSVRGLAYVLDLQGAIRVFAGTEITATLSGGSPNHIAVEPGGYAYVTQIGEGSVRVLEGKTLRGMVSLGGKVSGAAVVLTTTSNVYVALPQANQVAIFQGYGTVPVTYVNVGTEPYALAANPANGRIYVANLRSGTVSVLSGTSVIATIPVGENPVAVAVNPVNGYVYVANSASNTVSIIQNLAVIRTVNVGEAPGDIAVNPANGRVYVVNNGSHSIAGSLSVLQDAQAVPIATAQVGNDPRAVDVNPRSGYIYVVGGRGDIGTVAVLSDTLLIETFLPVGHSPEDVAVDPVSDLGYATLYKSTGGEMGQVVVLGRSEASVA
ncbi:MAG: YncE family protein, partial [Anaerolineae bacterium]|nr:YncE family protein [Anaerolineae bacterium]